MGKKNIINYKNYEIIWKGKEWKQIWINECNKKRRKMRERKVWVEYRKNKSRKDRKLVTVNAIEAQKKKKDKRRNNWRRKMKKLRKEVLGQCCRECRLPETNHFIIHNQSFNWGDWRSRKGARFAVHYFPMQVKWTWLSVNGPKEDVKRKKKELWMKLKRKRKWRSRNIEESVTDKIKRCLWTFKKE